MTQTQHMMIPAGFPQAKPSTVLANVGGDESLGAGIRSGFGVIGYRGKVWSTKWQGEEKPLMREDGDGARASIEVVIVKASPSISKIFYESGFVDGSTAPPDCWSTNGVTPDGGSPKKQSPTCAGCPKNAWGSKVTEAGKQAKACADSKRLAIVPLNDMKNELMGGPMLLRVPAASLKDLKTFGDTLQSYGYQYFAVAVRIAFDVQEAFPKFVFTAMRPLTDAEAAIVLEHRESQQVKNILNESVEIAQHEPAQALPSSPFENGAPPAQSQPATAQTAQPVAPAQTGQAPAPQQTVAPQPAGASPAPRKRRTKAEMEAAAAALRAKQAGGEPAAPAPTATVQATPAQPVPTPQVETPAAVVAENPSAGSDFDAMLDGLLPA